MSLLADVAHLLERSSVEHALIGAAGMAVHGVSRATADIDLLTVDTRVLDRAFWTELAGIGPRIALGDAEDPLAGTVRLGDEADLIDVVVGKAAWQAEAIRGAESRSIGEITVPVARPASLVLLKLFAGGPKDAWDIQSLLEVSTDVPALVREVERSLSQLPADAQRLWDRIRGGV